MGANERLNTLLYARAKTPCLHFVDELIAIRDQYQEQLRAIDSFDEQIGLLESQLMPRIKSCFNVTCV